MFFCGAGWGRWNDERKRSLMHETCKYVKIDDDIWVWWKSRSRKNIVIGTTKPNQYFNQIISKYVFTLHNIPLSIALHSRSSNTIKIFKYFRWALHSLPLAISSLLLSFFFFSVGVYTSFNLCTFENIYRRLHTHINFFPLPPSFQRNENMICKDEQVKTTTLQIYGNFSCFRLFSHLTHDAAFCSRTE